MYILKTKMVIDTAWLYIYVHVCSWSHLNKKKSQLEKCEFIAYILCEAWSNHSSPSMSFYVYWYRRLLSRQDIRFKNVIIRSIHIIDNSFFYVYPYFLYFLRFLVWLDEVRYLFPNPLFPIVYCVWFQMHTYTYLHQFVI